MPRIFASLSLACIVLFIATAGLAMMGGEANADRHILLAVIALLCSCFTQVVGFTYFTVTGKVLAQAVHLAKLDNACLVQVKLLKKSFTRCVGLIILAIVLSAATGGASWRTSGAATGHTPAAVAAIFLHLSVLLRQYRLISRNEGVVGTTLRLYSEWRVRRLEPGVNHESNIREGTAVPTDTEF